MKEAETMPDTETKGLVQRAYDHLPNADSVPGLAWLRRRTGYSSAAQLSKVAASSTTPEPQAQQQSVASQEAPEKEKMKTKTAVKGRLQTAAEYLPSARTVSGGMAAVSYAAQVTGTLAPNLKLVADRVENAARVAGTAATLAAIGEDLVGNGDAKTAAARSTNLVRDAITLTSNTAHFGKNIGFASAPRLEKVAKGASIGIESVTGALAVKEIFVNSKSNATPANRVSSGVAATVLGGTAAAATKAAIEFESGPGMVAKGAAAGVAAVGALSFGASAATGKHNAVTLAVVNAVPSSVGQFFEGSSTSKLPRTNLKNNELTRRVTDFGYHMADGVVDIRDKLRSVGRDAVDEFILKKEQFFRGNPNNENFKARSEGRRKQEQERHIKRVEKLEERRDRAEVGLGPDARAYKRAVKRLERENASNSKWQKKERENFYKTNSHKLNASEQIFFKENASANVKMAIPGAKDTKDATEQRDQVSFRALRYDNKISRAVSSIVHSSGDGLRKASKGMGNAVLDAYDSVRNNKVTHAFKRAIDGDVDRSSQVNRGVKTINKVDERNTDKLRRLEEKKLDLEEKFGSNSTSVERLNSRIGSLNTQTKQRIARLETSLNKRTNGAYKVGSNREQEREVTDYKKQYLENIDRRAQERSVTSINRTKILGDMKSTHESQNNAMTTLRKQTAANYEQRAELQRPVYESRSRARSVGRA
ncbi:hypothetical protein [uncultured Roseibium sp.]|uniref:hypothetical protein n=1 Tax=uncultured Roseibium sp. TaxID=1936171 RepID=UPI002633BB38|nr:hypothetical protein [uncultured Roseibium sp.]